MTEVPVPPGMVRKQFPCQRCGGSYEAVIPAGELNQMGGEGQAAYFAAALEAQADHICGTGQVTETHVRKQAAFKRGDGFYRPKYGSSEDGSQTLCGADPTDRDTSWGDARFRKNLAHVTCERCKQLRKERKGAR